MMMSKGVDDRDDDEDDIDATPVRVETCKLQNTETKQNLSMTAVFNLDTIVNNNKNWPQLDKFDIDASAVTVATKNSSAGKYNIPHRFFKNEVNQVVNSTKKPKKLHKKKQKHKK
mmetsp:Transcript_8892/g.9483  ORF Transcript_8892/g.9483 Transcript_8892/m.9483 type:complete len:115 (+) Transcript_8892:134-478(+)